MIEHTNGGTIFTGGSINYFRMCSLRSMVGLEIKGIKRRGRPAWKIVAEEFNIPNATKLRVYEWLDDKVKELQPQQEHRVRE